MTTQHDASSPRHATSSSGRASTWASAPLNVVRGGLVGAAESVPGISGGTIALVIGLYDQLIDAASQLVHAGRELVTGVVRGRGVGPGIRAVKDVNWPFLVPVLGGMAVVLLLSLKLIAPLLESHPVPTRAVFFGMIAVSIAVPLRMLPRRFGLLDTVLFLAAAAAAFVLTGLPAAEVDEPQLWYVFIGAAIAINALVLPGVSGSFLLLVMGLYVPVQHAIDQRDLGFVAVFALGALVGLGSFVKLLRWLLHNRRQGTMVVLSGLMLGSLRSLWPWQSESHALLAPTGSVAGPLLLALAGAGVVLLAILWESRASRDA
ncbi:DUF368 domain-containing protein [Myceligenerans indicum]|uniref:DUF368 domain-containing protein n=1 Tax=Myceligenerans indicum TaxID=2593663 RepID=A0ABS1LMK0_9MICO|nr:DUF368 domain-containing protein [Myceligenerans indicum]MBL0887278.1 DUF368 domain-containing protein [Myceligenerans indicum]